MLYVFEERTKLSSRGLNYIDYLFIAYFCAQIFSITFNGMQMKAWETAKNLGVAGIRFKAKERLV